VGVIGADGCGARGADNSTTDTPANQHNRKTQVQHKLGQTP
jgi:hypothetical protein